MHPADTFIILPLCDETGNLSNALLHLNDTRNFYKLFFIRSGAATVSVNDRRTKLAAGDIIFHRPGDRLTFRVTENSTGYVCLVNSEYLSGNSLYLQDLFRHFPLYFFHQTIIRLDNRQADIVQLAFESVIVEQTGGKPDKNQAIALHLQMILLQMQRASRLEQINYLKKRGSHFCLVTMLPFCYS